MRFIFTPEEAQKTAIVVARHLGRMMSVQIEKALTENAPYRTTLLGEAHGMKTLVDAQGAVNYHRELRQLSSWLLANRIYGELYIATSQQSGLIAGVLQDMQRDGVGLIVVDGEGRLSYLHRARNPALVVTPEPTLKYGTCKAEVAESLRKFNEVDRKDGLRDMCEIVERETEKLALLAVRRGLLKMSEQDIKAKDWSSQINTLASSNAYSASATPIVGPELKDDLHSFTRGRNLVDHKVRGKREEAKRQRQYAERMMQGPRLVAELVALQRRL